MFNLVMKFNISTKVQLTTSAPILAMQCYAFALFFIIDFQCVSNYFKNK